jgi:hypothetical protein
MTLKTLPIHGAILLGLIITSCEDKEQQMELNCLSLEYHVHDEAQESISKELVLDTLGIEDNWGVNGLSLSGTHEDRQKLLCIVHDQIDSVNKIIEQSDPNRFLRKIIIESSALYDTIPADSIPSRWNWKEWISNCSEKWPVIDQGSTQSCVGCALANGVLDIMYAKTRYEMPKEEIDIGVNFSPRYLWMMAKENLSNGWALFEDVNATIGTAMVALDQHGCPPDSILPLDLRDSRSSTGHGLIYVNDLDNRKIFKEDMLKSQILGVSFYSHKEGASFELTDQIKFHLTRFGPILIKLRVDESWRRVTNGQIRLNEAIDTSSANHVVSVIGYTTDEDLIVKNSAGTDFGDEGYILLSKDYYGGLILGAIGMLIYDNKGC